MKQTIIEALKAKFEGVSDNILGRIADKIAKTVTKAEEVETAVAGVTLQQVLESYGDSRATEAQATAVRNYESKYRLKDGKAIEQPTPPKPQETEPPRGGEEVPSWAQALVESNKQLTAKLQQLETERTTDIRRKQLDNLTESLPEAIRKAYSRTPIESLTDDDFNKLIADVNGEVETINQSISSTKSSRPFFARPGNADTLTKEQEAAITVREGMPNADGQPF